MRISAGDIGLDLGTANILIYVQNKGIVLRQPSIIALESASGEIVEAGAEAQRLLGRAPANIQVVRPIRDGIIANPAVTEKFMAYCIEKALGHRPVRKPRALICIPSVITAEEKAEISAAARRSGLSSALLIEEPVAAAIGAGLPVENPYGYMIVDIGGGTTDIAVISMGNVITSGSIRIGGDAFDEAIIRHLRMRHNLEIGLRSAENLKMQIGCVIPMEKTIAMEIAGKDLANGLPRNATITSEEIAEALHAPANSILSAIHAVFDQTPPELVADIYDHGVVMTGGGALLYGMDYLLSARIHAPVHLSDDPLSSVALGMGRILENWEEYASTILEPPADDLY